MTNKHIIALTYSMQLFCGVMFCIAAYFSYVRLQHGEVFWAAFELVICGLNIILISANLIIRRRALARRVPWDGVS